MISFMKRSQNESHKYSVNVQLDRFQVRTFVISLGIWWFYRQLMPPRRSKRSKSAKEQKHSDHDGEDTAVDLSKSVLGGMNGGSRLDGSEGKDQKDEGTLKLPFNDKFIICQRHLGPRLNGDDARSTSLIFTHGAGGGIANPATAEFARGYATASPVLCFQGTMNLKNRVKCFNAVLENESSAIALGGRSMGARAATITATEHPNRIQALILVSFPMTSERGGDSREDILLAIPESIDVLFITGDSDKMCHLPKLLEIRRKMTAKTWSLIVSGADHSMSLKQKRGVATMRAKTGQIAAEWLRQRSTGTEAIARWDDETSEVELSTWHGDLNASRPSKPAGDNRLQDPKPARKRQRKK
ncbi:hypothetical protein BDZ85DRAFT_254054 [Elsinoe ampelina]|uniref:KANL3/Tex30 alpha/beta hydrolase-like domain-containing protein n=1 Tax=Elsinoe ampelina TaxID=302913 RepID=A0A6A6GNG1_9PEZI|nr:hypothetical protein BDZ85DRAFT_254054 [Elsinoe ampelina]